MVQSNWKATATCGIVSVVCACTAWANNPPVVTGVVASQRTDGSKIVDIYYNLADGDGDACTVTVQASSDGGATWTVPITAVTGAVGGGIAPGSGKHVTWQSATDLPGAFGSLYKVRVCADDSQGPGGNMVLIPAGEYQMGDTFNEGGSDEQPVHSVYVSSFYIDAHEVTNAQYAAGLNWALGQGLLNVSGGVVYKAGGSPYCDTTSSSSYSRITWSGSTFGVVAGKEDHPIVMVSWYGAAAYCNWRSAMEGRTPCYNTSTWTCNFSENGYRLPTEAEWEKAARGGASGHRFPWSDTNTIQHARANYKSSSSYSYDTSPTRGHHPGFDDDGWPYTSPVGYFSPNGYGVYDAAGNVFEWCNDWYLPDYYNYSPYTNPLGPTDGYGRVLRGGTGNAYAEYCRVASRSFYSPATRGHGGFRCAAGNLYGMRASDCTDSVAFTLDNSGVSGLTGVVVEIDGQGQVLGPLSGATVAVTGGGEMTTPGSGQFSFGDLDPGPVTVTVSKAGYHTVARALELAEGETSHQTFQLLAASGGATPGAFDFYSPDGDHLIEGMPGDVSFEVTVAWNGSAGSVYYYVADGQYTASVTDLGGGLARATLTLPAPSAVDACSEVTIEVVNGEGHSTFFNTGVHISPNPGIVAPWYQDDIPWTPSGMSLYYSDSSGLGWDLALPGTDLELHVSGGLERSLAYNLLGVSFDGSLEGYGAFDFDWDVPGVHIEILAGGQLNAGGNLAISLAGCGPPQITPGWAVSFTGKAGVGAPAVLVVDVIFPPAAPIVHGLLSTPIIGDVVGALRLRVFLIGGAGVSAEYPDGQWSDQCFLGADAININGTFGIEAQAVLELAGAEAGVYAGGTGSPEFEVCPDFEFQSVTLQAYVGVFASAGLFEFSEEVGAEVCFGNCAKRGVVGGVLVDAPPYNGKWRPIGDSLRRWGPCNRLVHERAVRLAGSGSLSVSGRALEETLVENVTRLAGPAVIADPTETHITYALHDPNKPWHQATDIASARSINGDPWTMERIADDFVADYNPVIAPVDADFDVAAWAQVDGDVSGAVDPGDVAPYLEIAASWFDRTTEQWSAPVLLEDNGVVDRAPQPVLFANTTGVVWIQNEGDATPGHATSGDRLVFAEWDSGGWSAPQTLWTGAKGIMSFSFAEDLGGEGHIVFAVDEDGDLETTDDRELYGIQTAAGVWQTAALLTTDAIEDALPVLVAPDGEVLCVWASGPEVVYTRLASWNPQPVYAEYTLANEAPSLDGVTMPGGAAVAYTVQTPDGIDVVAAFYDALIDQWSLPRQLTQDEHAESAVSLACDSTQLVMAYLKTQTERNEVDIDIGGEIYHLEDVPQPGRTDLCVLRHTLGHDLAVDVDSVVFEPANPEPGTTVTIRATVENRGELIAADVECAFYDGDPDAGGALIDAIQTVPGDLIAGSSCEVAATWDVPTIPMPHDVHVVVDPALVFDDRDRANNSTFAQTVLPDITVESASSEQVSYRSVALTAQCSNLGVNPTGAFDLSWRLGSAAGTEIGRTTVGSVVAGAARDATFYWDTGDYTPGEWVQVYIVADDLAEVVEQDEANNVHSLAAMVPEVMSGDMDRDGDIDLDDFGLWATCMAGPNVLEPPPGCDPVTFAQADFDGDGDVDVADFALLQRLFGN